MLINRQKGFVLPMSLIVLALLTVLSMGLSQMARNHISDVQQRKQLFEQELKMKGSVQWVLYQLLTGVADKRVVNTGALVLPIDGQAVVRGGVEVRVQDAAGLLGLAYYQQDIVQSILENYVTEEEARGIAAKLGDWIDDDQRARYLGMEASDYVAEGRMMLPRNAPLRSLDELLELPGITPEIYNGGHGRAALRDLLLAGGVENFNFATAPNELIRSVMKVKGQELQQLLALRKQGDWQSLRHQLEAYPTFRGGNPFQPGFEYRIMMLSSEGYALRAMYRVTVSNSVPYELILWQYPDHERG